MAETAGRAAQGVGRERHVGVVVALEQAQLVDVLLAGKPRRGLGGLAFVEPHAGRDRSRTRDAARGVVARGAHGDRGCGDRTHRGGRNARRPWQTLFLVLLKKLSRVRRKSHDVVLKSHDFVRPPSLLVRERTSWRAEEASARAEEGDHSIDRERWGRSGVRMAGRSTSACVQCTPCPHGGRSAQRLRTACNRCCPHGKHKRPRASDCNPCPHGKFEKQLRGLQLRARTASTSRQRARVDACKAARAESAGSTSKRKRDPEIKPKPEIKPEPEIKEEPEPFTIRGYFGFHD